MYSFCSLFSVCPVRRPSLLLLVPSLHDRLVLPNAARVVLRPCNNSVSFVVESARKDLVLMPVQSLQLVPRVCRPHLASLVTARSNYLVPLRIKLDFAYFIFMALKQCDASASENVINARHSVSARSCQFVTCSVKTCV
jgi:hypothetical protein